MNCLPLQAVCRCPVDMETLSKNSRSCLVHTRKAANGLAQIDAQNCNAHRNAPLSPPIPATVAAVRWEGRSSHWVMWHGCGIYQPGARVKLRMGLTFGLVLFGSSFGPDSAGKAGSPEWQNAKQGDLRKRRSCGSEPVATNLNRQRNHVASCSSANGIGNEEIGSAR